MIVTHALYYYYWSFLYSTILYSWANSLCSCPLSHVVLNEWLHPPPTPFFFYSMFFQYPMKWCTDSATWLLHGWCHVQRLPSWCKLCAHHTTMHQFTVSLHSNVHRLDVCVFSCNLPPALLAEWPGSVTGYCAVTWGWNWYWNKSQHKNFLIFLSLSFSLSLNNKPFVHSFSLSTKPSMEKGCAGTYMGEGDLQLMQ